MNDIIKKFFHIFEEDTTTNFDLLRYAKILKIKKFQVVMTDEVNNLPENNFCAIMNFQLTSQSGTHWVALYKKENSPRLLYFDSYGLPVQEEVIKKYVKIRTADYQFQKTNESFCGQISLLFIYLLNNGYGYVDVIEAFKDYFMQ